MATRQHRVGDIFSDTDQADVTDAATEQQALPPEMPALFAWLDEQPHFIEFTKSYTMSHHRNHGWVAQDFRSSRTVSHEFEREQTVQMLVPHDGYEETGRKSYSSQRDVVDAWEQEQFPTHNIVEYDGRRAAELYTLSSYQQRIDGPSRMVPIYSLGGEVEVPAVRVECELCDWTSHTAPDAGDAISGTYRRPSLGDHFEEEHPDVALQSVRSSTFGKATVPEDSSLYTINEGHAVTESAKNFRALQFPDGSGLVEHYDTIESIRTRNGTVLSNSQCFAKGNAHCSYASDRDLKLPLNGIQAMLEEDESLFDITDVVVDAVNIYIRGNYDSDTGEWDYSEAEIRRQGVDSERGRVVVLDNGHGIGIVHDETASNRHERTVGFRLEPDEVDALRSADDVYELLKPNTVSAYEQRGYDVVSADTYSGRGATYYTEDLLGDAIVRQGEWYFIPMDEGFSPDAPVYHQYRRRGWDAATLDGFTAVDGVPSECANCGATSFDVSRSRSVCTECGHAHLTKFATLSEDERPFDPTVLGNHLTREVAVEDDGSVYVRGSVRHRNSEHRMINLRDRWHLAVENTKDGVVYDKSTPDSVSGRSVETAGIARIE